MTKKDQSDKIYKNLSDVEIETITAELAEMPSFAGSDNKELSEKHLAVMTHNAGEKLKEFFDILKLDYKNDPNLKDTPKRVASMYINELMGGRYASVPRIASFPMEWNQADKQGVKEFKQLKAKLDAAPIVEDSEVIEAINLLKSNGYKLDIKDVDTGSIVIKKVDINSLCSHHFMPFVTTTDDNSYALVAYVPNPKQENSLLGISKIQRVVDYFGRRPQLQEHLTWQIYAFLAIQLESLDIMVSLHNITHYCEKTRGVESHCGSTSSIYYGGIFNHSDLRREVITMVK